MAKFLKIIILFLSGCLLACGEPSGLGSVQANVLWPQDARARLAPANVAFVRVTLSGPTIVDVTQSVGAGGVFLDKLEPGAYVLSVFALNANSDPQFSGSQAVDVYKDQIAEVSVTLDAAPL